MLTEEMHVLYIPVRTHSKLNQRLHWAARARQTKTERRAAYLLAPNFPLPCTIRLVRIAPRALDDDAIPGAMKGIRDGIADRLGLPNDRDPRVTWEYGQQRGRPKEYGVHVCFSQPDLIA